jgi:hypothetical protein
MKSVMQHMFSQVPKVNIPRSSFNRSCGLKTTFDSGYLVPVFVDEALPGDTFNLNMTSFTRMATPIHPFMDNVFMDSFFFAVPVRLIWDNFQKFNGEQDNPGDSTDYTIPTMTTSAGFAEDSLSDYFGIPTKVAGLEVSSLWHRAYNLIYNEWFRDQNIIGDVVVDTDDGPDSESDYVLLRRGKRHDYFTSCLPWPQKNDSVDLPLGEKANIAFDGTYANVMGVVGTNYSQNEAILSGTSGSPVYINNSTVSDSNLLYADLSDATAATINQLRQAFQLQKLYEKDARGGTRYTEIIRSHFGVVSPDARLQRPEFLGGGTTRININPVAQSSSTDATTPQGNLAAFAVGSGVHGFTKSFTEHCVLIGMVSVRADLTYQQGLDRMFSRSTRWDHYWPSLAHIGEQAVLSKEIYADGTSSDDDVFGYQERYAEYRYKPSKITGKFRSNCTTSLDTWHLAQDFSTRPTLNQNFIEENPPIDRVVAVTTEPEFLFDSYFDLKCARPMPVYSVPGLIDHF